MRECCRQNQAGVVSKSRYEIHQTWRPPFGLFSSFFPSLFTPVLASLSVQIVTSQTIKLADSPTNENELTLRATTKTYAILQTHSTGRRFHRRLRGCSETCKLQPLRVCLGPSINDVPYRGLTHATYKCRRHSWIVPWQKTAQNKTWHDVAAGGGEWDSSAC